MDREANTKRIPGFVKFIFFLLIVIAVYFSRKYYIALQYPYRDLDVIGSWDYSYSVTFDVDKKPLRTDKELFSLEMYTETEIVLNDDGSFSLSVISGKGGRDRIAPVIGTSEEIKMVR